MIDLHTHTTASDGDYSPEKIIDIAISKGISTLAITDHDNINGVERAYDYAKGKNITFIPGIEVSARVPRGEMHILGLFIDFRDKEFQDYLNYLQARRVERNERYVKLFNELGYHITIEDIKEISGGKIIAKPHFAKWLVNNGYFKDIDDAFDNCLNVPPISSIKKETYAPDDIIKHIRKNGGLAILAHPQSLKLSFSDLAKELKVLKSYGLDGMECYHSNQTPEEMYEFRKIAEELDLLISKGSDFHGPKIKSDIELGSGINGNIIIDENEEKQILEKMYKTLKDRAV